MYFWLFRRPPPPLRGGPRGCTSTPEGEGSGFEPRAHIVFFINLRQTSEKYVKHQVPSTKHSTRGSKVVRKSSTPTEVKNAEPNIGHTIIRQEQESVQVKLDYVTTRTEIPSSAISNTHTQRCCTTRNESWQ